MALEYNRKNMIEAIKKLKRSYQKAFNECRNLFEEHQVSVWANMNVDKLTQLKKN